MMLARLSSIAALGAALCGCMVGPNYHRASAPVATQYKEPPPEGWAEAAPSDAAPKGDWWTDFHDPLLDELEPQVACRTRRCARAMRTTCKRWRK
jgi:outer membrane protein TolC